MFAKIKTLLSKYEEEISKPSYDADFNFISNFSSMLVLALYEEISMSHEALTLIKILFSSNNEFCDEIKQTIINEIKNKYETKLGDKL